MPGRILWAWERPEDLRFIDPKEYGVAFLAQTLFVRNGEIVPKPRRQPLDVPPATYLIAVTRIETDRRSALPGEEVAKLISLVRSTLEMPGVRAVQIDYDAAKSERPFYRSLTRQLRGELPADVPLTMTALASWCIGDAWFDDLPVDEAVPMIFRMGTDSDRVRSFLRNGNDFNEPLCKGSYGLSLDEPLDAELKPGRRIYLFKDSPWNSRDLDHR